MPHTRSKSLVPESARFDPSAPTRAREAPSLDDRSCVDVFAEALSGLQPMELRVVHLAMSRAAVLEAAGRGAEADALLLGILRTLDDEPPGATRVFRRQNAS